MVEKIKKNNCLIKYFNILINIIMACQASVSNQKPAGLTKSGTNDGEYGDTEQQMRGSTRTFSHVTACGKS